MWQSTRTLACALVLTGLAACAGSPATPEGTTSSAAPAAATDPVGEDIKSTYAKLVNARTGVVYELEPSSSRVRIYVFRVGRGHVHVMSVPQMLGMAYVSQGTLGGSRFDISVALESLAVDDPAVRQETGGEFGEVLDESAIKGTREHMLGADCLDVAHFPEIRMHSVSIIGDLPHAVVNLQVTLHGVTRVITVPLQVNRADTMLAVRGMFVLRQTDFGVHPYTALGGLLAVEDDLDVEFELSGHRVAPDTD